MRTTFADELQLGERIGQRFRRSEPRHRAAGYIRGLRGVAERKNGWQMAERLSAVPPDGVQHLFARAGRDADAVRDDLTAYFADNLGRADGVLVVDETEGREVGRDGAAVLGHGRPDRELLGRRLPRLFDGARPGFARPGAVPA